MQSMVSAGGSGGDGKSADDAWFLDVPKRFAAWCWLEHVLFTFHIFWEWLIIPTDELNDEVIFFQRGMYTTNQIIINNH